MKEKQPAVQNRLQLLSIETPSITGGRIGNLRS
jgi:hypothetical protein